ncbi:Hypothetical protein FKW44_016111 [Caligus rogercresseyi]|uniref:Uncharacterized protein n=1 Tax=Caligus rogercresseyi TaxID=217165 RepID=A0A7T8K069_CALRO|nr:Hypothetical protein FKW44_016111 [Caligus rogercresseyi]
MSLVNKFVEDITVVGKTPKDIKTMVVTIFEVNSISQSQIYRILALVKTKKDSSDKKSTNVQTGVISKAPKGLQPTSIVLKSRSKEEKRILSFFDNCSVIFQHYLPMKKFVTAAVLKDVMSMF